MALRIELAPGADASVSVGGNVFGTPREVIEAQVIDTNAFSQRSPAQTSVGETPRSGQKVDEEVRLEATRRVEEGSQKEGQGLDSV